jgi:hypothetical protein
VLNGFSFVALLFIYFAEHVETLGVDIAIINSARPHNKKNGVFILCFLIDCLQSFIDDIRAVIEMRTGHQVGFKISG